jgi:hypothetical protein
LTLHYLRQGLPLFRCLQDCKYHCNRSGVDSNTSENKEQTTIKEKD